MRCDFTMKKYTFRTTFGDNAEVYLKLNTYVNPCGLCVSLIDADNSELYARITVNLEGADLHCSGLISAIDVNNTPEAIAFIEENNLGEFTGLDIKSGRCIYPVYRFHEDMLRDACPDDFACHMRIVNEHRFTCTGCDNTYPLSEHHTVCLCGALFCDNCVFDGTFKEHAATHTEEGE